jgi:hypothetical protein
LDQEFPVGLTYFSFMRHDGMNVFKEVTMLKEVGASGQISLGKKYAGQLFEMEIQPDGSIVMRPVKVVPLTLAVHESQAPYGPVPQQQAQLKKAAGDWAQTHAAEIDQYNAWAAQREPYSQRVRRWREQGAVSPE